MIIIIYFTFLQLVWADILSFQPSSTRQPASVGTELINLNPSVNLWYLLKETKEGNTKYWHLENPTQLPILIDKKNKSLLKIGPKSTCMIPSITSVEYQKTYTDVCDGLLYVRFRVPGKETTKEWGVRLLRDSVWGGEKITSLVKDIFYKDKHIIHSKKTSEKINPKAKNHNNTPMPAIVLKEHQSTSLEPEELGISLKNNPKKLAAGKWYPTKFNNHIWLSTIEPQMAPKATGIGLLDKTEKTALTYLVAFDIDKMNTHFIMGTDHPRVGWSKRASDIQDKSAGPDGFDKIEPIVVTGKVPTYHKAQATFTGGFKRSHGAFKWGKLGKINNGSHYGFAEKGILFSRLIPDLATFMIAKNHKPKLLTWPSENPPEYLSARQNGVPLIDNINGAPVPGKLVNDWSQGNWSGSQQKVQRALRAGVCLQKHNGKDYLLYGYFSSVTAKAMARVFLSYGCVYAMHLDMNALEHTYLALYKYEPKNIKIEYLISGMHVLDKEKDGQKIPRFLGTADNRDFFYFTKDKTK